ncbi:ZGRF1 protein, partial [Turnix velox]|nr:ZGRF1 protein [Turnix velox]
MCLKQVLYTHQKMKKSKTWQDGVLRIRTGGNKAVLFDDKGQCLESIFIKSQVNAGDNLESERYLITVEAVKVNEKSVEVQPKEAGTLSVDKNGVKPGVMPPRHLSVGLKRKFTGFQGPRQVEKKVLTTDVGENSTTLPLSKQCQGTFPSKFYNTSPLFSTISKRETNVSANFPEDACTDNDREHTSLSSLLSVPFLDRYEEVKKQDSEQSIGKLESPLITGHITPCNQLTGHREVSHNIRSTAQIMALLKSKPTQRCRKQATSEVTGCLSSFAFSGKSAERLVQNVKHLPSTKGPVNDVKEQSAEILLHSSEQICDKGVTEQAHVKKANDLSQELENPCSTTSFFLSESALNRMSDSQLDPFSGDILHLAGQMTVDKNLSRYREYSVTNDVKEDSSVKLHRELQMRQSTGSVPGELAVDVTWTDNGIVKEELNTHDKHYKNDGNCCTEGIPSQLYHSNVRDAGRIAADSANQTRTKVELSDDEQNVKEINECQLSIEAMTNKKVLGGSEAYDVNGISWIKSKHSDPLSGNANANECHPKSIMVEKAENISCIATSKVISGQMGKDIEGDVIHLGCLNTPDADLEHCWETKGDDVKPGSPLLALSRKSDPSHGLFQFIEEDHENIFSVSHNKNSLISKSSICPLSKGHFSQEETAVGETVLENVETINTFQEACLSGRNGMDCLKGTSTVESSSPLPDLVNNIALVRALTQHSTALESLQQMEENNSILYE